MYGPDVAIYGSHGMRHTGFSQVDGGQRDPRIGTSQLGIRAKVNDYLGSSVGVELGIRYT